MAIAETIFSIPSYAQQNESQIKYMLMPKLILEQLCDNDKSGCRYYIGGVASVFYYDARGLICFPMKEDSGFETIDLDLVIESAKSGLSRASAEQEAAPVLYNVWKVAYPCKK
jgi:hypothetical protein